MWTWYLDASCGLDEVDCVHAVLLHARANGEDVGVKDDVVGIEAYLTDQSMVGSGADLHFPLRLCCLWGAKTSEHHTDSPINVRR